MNISASILVRTKLQGNSESRKEEIFAGSLTNNPDEKASDHYQKENDGKLIRFGL